MYSTENYKKHLTEENKADILNLFEAVNSRRCDHAENLLLAILEKVINRNPENRSVNQGDFSLVMLLEADFDNEYHVWLSERGTKGNDTDLLTCCSKPNSMAQLLEEAFLYLERDYYKPQKALLEAIEAYKHQHRGNELDEVLSSTSSIMSY